MAVWSLRNDGYCWGKARCCEGLRADALKKKSRVYPLRDGFCALWAQGLFFYVIWAASGGGRWGPVRGCRPSEAPSALPPDDPAGLVAYLHSHGVALRGFPYAVIPRGLRGLRSGSFLASLGDLPPRRAMPSHAFALHGKLPQMSHRVGCTAY